jgi:hypothetical protein
MQRGEGNQCGKAVSCLGRRRMCDAWQARALLRRDRSVLDPAECVYAADLLGHGDGGRNLAGHWQIENVASPIRRGVDDRCGSIFCRDRRGGTEFAKGSKTGDA